MSESEPIKVSLNDARERKRRHRELLIALAAVLVVGVLTVVELKYLGVDSYLFLVFFNLNVIILLVILFVVLRNFVKLFLERRRKVLGAQLRTRLVTAFILLSIIPTLLLFFVSLNFVQTSVDYWFKSQVGTSMKMSLEVGQAFYGQSRGLLENYGALMLNEIQERKLLWGGRGMEVYLEKCRTDYALGLVGVLDPARKPRIWQSTPVWEPVWTQAHDSIDWKDMAAHPKSWSNIVSGKGLDAMVIIFPVDQGKTGWLVLGLKVEQGLKAKLDQIVRGVEEYNKLDALKFPLKMALYIVLGVMTLLIILGATWFGFRVAKEISAPVQALVQATERIAKGDLGVRLEDAAPDELGMLVQSFNRMAGDLENSRSGLTEANVRLGLQNVELEQRGRYIEAILDNITAGVVSIDRTGVIGTVNKAAEVMLRVDASEVIGRSPLELVSGPYVAMLTQVLGQMQTHPDSRWQSRVDLMMSGREARFLVNVVGLRSAEGQESGIVAVFEDITELEKMQRLDAWREVAKRIAHEIKNPLTPIKLSAERLRRKYYERVGDPVFAQCTDLIVRQVEHMQQMVAEFSKFAKLPEISPRLGRIAPILSEVFELFRNSHSWIVWRLECADDIPPFKFDAEALRRVFLNLFTNAAEALDGFTNAEVHIRADVADGRFVAAVADNGPGLSEDEYARLFEPYYSRKKGGTGLGLTIVKSLVTDHRGHIRVSPNSPRGTVFELTLPLD